MKLKNAIIFFIAATIFIYLGDTAMNIYTSINYKTDLTMSIVLGTLYILIPASLITSVMAWRSGNDQLRKIAAAFLMAIAAGWVAYGCYSLYTSMGHPYYKENKFIVIKANMIMLQTISLAFAGFAFFRGNNKWIRITIWILLFVSVAICINKFTDVLNLLSQYSLLRYAGAYMIPLLSGIYIAFHIALAALCLSILQFMQQQTGQAQPVQTMRPGDDLLDNQESKVVAAGQTTAAEASVPSVTAWLSDILAAMIPFAGFVFLVWRGFSTRDRYRRNWAAGTIFITILGSIFNVYIYASLLSRVVNPENLLLCGALFILVLLAIWTGMAVKIRDERNDYPDEMAYIPTVWTWVGRMLIAAIPVVGLIMIIDWSADKDDDMARRNWARAMLIRLAINTYFMVMLYFSLRHIFDGVFNF